LLPGLVERLMKFSCVLPRVSQLREVHQPKRMHPSLGRMTGRTATLVPRVHFCERLDAVILQP
jgi:hypothetical protein